MNKNIVSNETIENDVVLRSIVEELKNKYHCHTVILYGSRARGDYTPTSDYDVAGISQSSEKHRIARFDPLHNVYHDIFIYSENDFSTLQEEYLNMSDGKVIIEANNFGKNLLNQLKHFEPALISENEIQTRKVWYKKMAARAAVGDIEGKYRHIWAIFAILEDYFVFRAMRYEGPKKAFQYLEQHDPKTLALFNKALNNMQDVEILNKLIASIVNE
ncbi:MAG: nucleotidyltransferase domain-containing protein [Tatlockia sp.]|jgi:predicted nucleotidyltransferase